MYKAKLWDEDKWNIHSSSYNSSKYSSTLGDGKKDERRYNEQRYGLKEKSVSSDYIRKQDEREREDKAGIFEDLEEEKREKEELKDEEIPFKAAKLVLNESKYETKRAENRKNINTIEDAIKKSIEEEKKVIIMDN